MADQNLSLIDRLQERGLIDRWGFTTFAAVGSFAILGAKWYKVETWVVATGAIGFMLLYAVIVNMRGTGKLRSDQAGDNCYYLGLIYTLTSLAYAIFTFDPEKTATTIVQGFGIALATTIAGLVLRVFFNQSRVDLFEAEDTARLELAEAAGKLKTELAQIAVEFKHFALGLQQSVEEVRNDAAESVNRVSEASIASVQGFTSEVIASLRKQAEELNTNSSELAKKTSAVARAIDRHSTSIDSITDAHHLIVADVEALTEVTKGMRAHSQQLVTQTQATHDLQQGTLELIASINQSTAGVLGSVQSSLSTIQKFETVFADRLKELEDGPKAASDKALTAIAGAAEAVRTAMANLNQAQEQALQSVVSGAVEAARSAMSDLTEVQKQAIQSVSASTDGILTVVRGHNDELEAELEKSRANVMQVQAALLEVTPKLADVVE